MLKLEEIEGKNIRLYLSPLNYECEDSINEFCFFYLDVYRSTSLYFVIVGTEGQEAEHVIETDETLSSIVDRATQNARSRFQHGKYAINEEIKRYIYRKLFQNNEIVYEKKHYRDYDREPKPSTFKETLKGCLGFIFFYIIIILLVFLYKLIFE